MKALCVVEKNRLEFREFPEPALGAFDALVRVLSCGICNSTDWKILTGEFVSGTFPTVLGHESVGEVVKIGAKVKNFAVGDIVLRPKLRDEHVPVPGGRSRWGGFSELGVVTDAWAEKGEPYNAFPHPQQIVPASMPVAEAVALITLKEVLSCLIRTEVEPGQSLAIVGTGPVAQGLAMWAGLMGIGPVVVFGRRAELSKRFLDFGAEAYVVGDDIPSRVKEILQRGGFDRAIEAVGARVALTRCLHMTRPTGRVNLYGLAPESEPYLAAEEKDPRVFRSKVVEAEVHDRALEHVAAGRVRMADWYSDEMPWESFQKGFDLVHRRLTNKVVLNIAKKR
jgi:threonine dehydrogenase-like Zn-dependent dehydrogenase